MTYLSTALSRAPQLKLVLFAVLAIGMLAMTAGRGTEAWFTTQVQSVTNVFTSGTLKFKAGDIDETGVTPSVTASIGFAATMKPGDTVYAPIEIDNVGSLAAKFGILYTTTTTGTNLAPGLDLAIVGKGTGTGTKTNTTLNATACNATTFGTAAVWSEQTIRVNAAMVAAGETIVPVASSTLLLPAVNGLDILCMKVTFHDSGAPLSLTTQDNFYNNVTIGATNTTVAFVFDGLTILVFAYYLSADSITLRSCSGAGEMNCIPALPKATEFP